jgi:hypothetical protein
MMTWALWNEFSKLPHVTLEFQSIYEPLPNIHPDFVLFHACFGDLEFGQLAAMRRMAKYKTMSFMELGLPKEHVDYCFVYLPPTITHCEEIPLPCLSAVLDEHNSAKSKGTILLDHVWPPYCGTNKEWSPRLYNWLTPLKHRFAISQLRRGGCSASENFPNWVAPIEEKPYTEYLDITARFETYILTHPGSYEHSVIDMAYRGTQVLVPIMDGKPFIPKSTVERLNLSTFSTKFELAALLERPARVANKRQSFSDMSKVVSRIDAYCQRELSWT